jgi:glycosyltransferase involved in cell wall biosynthesis
MKIAYVGPFSLSSSNANYLRVLGVSKSFVNAGHDVIICAGTKQPDTQKAVDGYSEIELVTTDEYAHGLLTQIPGIRGLFIGNSTIKWLDSLKVKPDVVLLYGTHFGYLCRLLKYCRKHSIRLIVDITEWYDPRYLPGGLLGPYAILNELSMRYVVPKVKELFVISQFLECYFSKKNCRTIRVPPLFESTSSKNISTSLPRTLTNFVYCGSPGKKESFDILCEGLFRAAERNAQIRLHIIGLNESDFFRLLPSQITSKLFDGKHVSFYGRLPNSEARKIVASCEFSLLLRKQKRFSQAGFPSKIPESMSLGTPVVTNYFSDLSLFLKHDSNSIIIKEHTAESVARAVSHAASLGQKELQSLRLNALQTANDHFSPQNFSRTINQFLSVNA